MSQGGPEIQGAWNSGPKWRVVSDREQQAAVDGGDGRARVGLTPTEETLLSQMAARTMSDPAAEPMTGAELGAGLAPGMAAGALDDDDADATADSPLASNGNGDGRGRDGGGSNPLN